jgi:thiol:disulfide interchange protein
VIRRRTLLALVLMGTFVGPRPVAGQDQTRPAAADVVAAAVARAKAEQKAVLIEFGASWCTWCRNFEAFVQSADAGPVLAHHFVIVNLTVHERDDKKALEHPGGNALMDEWGGATSGLPFYVFVSDAGQKVADSNAMPDGTNIGFPAVPDEIRAFISLMERAAPALSSAERDGLSRHLARVAP